MAAQRVEVVLGGGVVAVEVDGPLVRGQRVVAAPRRLIGEAQMVLDLRGVGHEARRLLEMMYGVAGVARGQGVVARAVVAGALHRAAAQKEPTRECEDAGGQASSVCAGGGHPPSVPAGMGRRKVSSAREAHGMRQRGIGREIGRLATHGAIAALLIWGVGATRPALAETPATLRVTGSGSVHAPPDLALLDAGVTSEAPQAGEAILQNSESMRRVLEALDARGVARADVQTRNLQLRPVYEQGASRQRGALTGYRASSHIRVRVRELDQAGPVLDTLVAAGANEIGNIAFDVQDRAPLLDRARVAAVADAKRKARLLASEAGGRLGALLEVRDGESPALPVARGVRMDAGFAAQSVPVAAGELEFRASVHLVYALEALP